MFEGVRWRKSRILNAYSFAFWPFLSVSQSEPTQLLLLSELILLKCQILSLTFKCLFLWCFFEVKRGCSAMFSQGCFCRLIRQEFKSGVSARLRCRGSNLSSLFFFIKRSLSDPFDRFSWSFQVLSGVIVSVEWRSPNIQILKTYWYIEQFAFVCKRFITFGFKQLLNTTFGNQNFLPVHLKEYHQQL